MYSNYIQFTQVLLLNTILRYFYFTTLYFRSTLFIWSLKLLVILQIEINTK